MRVVFQILTDSHKWAFPLMGISAWVEVTGLILWALDLWRAMGRAPIRPWLPVALAIGPRTKVFEVIENYPETVALFRQFGFSMIENPMAQRIFARSVSLGAGMPPQACRFCGFRKRSQGARPKNSWRPGQPDSACWPVGAVTSVTGSAPGALYHGIREQTPWQHPLRVCNPLIT